LIVRLLGLKSLATIGLRKAHSLYCFEYRLYHITAK
jgi:hypothetical protein